eukprot:scaffold2428_cov412-Prasinococcus_capsulatus_cf.AAC.3
MTATPSHVARLLPTPLQLQAGHAVLPRPQRAHREGLPRRAVQAGPLLRAGVQHHVPVRVGCEITHPRLDLAQCSRTDST